MEKDGRNLDIFIDTPACFGRFIFRYHTPKDENMYRLKYTNEQIKILVEDVSLLKVTSATTTSRDAVIDGPFASPLLKARVTELAKLAEELKKNAKK